MNIVNIMTCGSVDDGKSTLLGRLLYETENIFEDQSEYLKKLNDKYRKKYNELDYSLLLDGLIDEKEQGITIDIAFKYFVLNKTQFMLIDSPGHKEFTKNMANAATYADVALVLLDASKGISTQTKKHIEIINMFPNIRTKILCINKIDKINYSKIALKKLNTEIDKYLLEQNYNFDAVIPISALNGDNVLKKSKRLKDYKGPTVYEFLTSVKKINKVSTSGLAILKFVDNSTGKRIYYFENINLNFEVGDNLTNVYSGEVARVKKIYHNLEQKKDSKNLKNISLELYDNISISKGEALVKDKQKELLSDTFKAKIVWFSDDELLRNKRYKFRFQGKIVGGFVSKSDKKTTKKNDIVTVQIELEEKVHIAKVDENYYLSQFILLDTSTNSTAGFGYINQNLDRGISVIKNNIQKYSHSKYPCLWFTGLPSSGKSSIAEQLGKKLDKLNIKYYILDGDNMRSSINKDLGFTKEDRIENNRRIAHMSRILFDSGVMPIVTTISPNNDSRVFARSLYLENEFSLIYIKASLQECMKRDPKNLYNNKLKKVKNITGLDTNFDIPTDYELILDTELLSINRSVNKLLKFLNL